MRCGLHVLLSGTSGLRLACVQFLWQDFVLFDRSIVLESMENPEEILHSLEEFAKLKPKDIPRELEEYLCFVAKTGDPVYQWSAVKSLFREKLSNVITEFYESCPSVEIPPCRNVDIFKYNSMKNFILEKLDSFSAAPFTVQRICELLTTPRKEYNRIDKYMRALEKNILVVSTTEPGNRHSNNDSLDGIVNGVESEHAQEVNIPNNEINVDEMDDMPSWPRVSHQETTFQSTENGIIVEPQTSHILPENIGDTFGVEAQPPDGSCSSISDSTGLTCTSTEQQPYVSIEPVASDSCLRQENLNKMDRVSVTITAIPTAIQKRRNSIEPVISSEPVVDQSSTSSQSDTSKVSSEVTETPAQTDELDVAQQTAESTVDSTSPSFPQETDKIESSSDAADDEEEEEEQSITATSELIAVETNEIFPSVEELTVQQTTPEPIKTTCEELEAKPTEVEEISSTDLKSEEDSETNIEKELGETEEHDKEFITSSTEETLNEASTTSEDRVVTETQQLEEAGNDEDNSVVEERKEEPEVTESGSPTVQESDSSSIEHQEPQMPMEVDEKNNEFSGQFVEVTSQSSDSGDS